MSTDNYTSQINTSSPNGDVGGYKFEHPSVGIRREPPPQDVKQDIIRDYTPAVPHVETYTGQMNALNKTYYTYFDEALRDNIERTLAMRRDGFVHELLRHRQIPVSILPHEILPDDPDDREQEQIADIVDKIYSSIKKLKKIKVILQEAVFYGKYGVEVQIGPRRVSGNTWNSIVNSIPINGDKIRYKWTGIPGIAIRTGAEDDDNDGMNKYLKKYEQYIENTNLGRVLFLKDEFLRDRFIIHEFEPFDTDYLFEIDMAQSVHGLGMRSRMYWTWNMRVEILSWVVDAIQRIGANGMLFGFYKSGNVQSRDAVLASLTALVKDNIAAFEIDSNDPNYKDIIQRIEPSAIGYEVMLQIVEYFDGIMRRAFLGQNLSSQSDATGLGSGVAELQGMTYESMIKYDAIDLGETQDEQMLSIILKYNKFRYRGKVYRGVDLPFGMKLRYNFESSNVQSIIQAASELYQMGVPLDEDEVRQKAGFTKPRDRSTFLMNPQIEQMKQEAKNAASPMGQAQQGMNAVNKAISGMQTKPGAPKPAASPVMQKPQAPGSKTPEQHGIAIPPSGGVKGMGDFAQDPSAGMVDQFVKAYIDRYANDRHDAGCLMADIDNPEAGEIRSFGKAYIPDDVLAEDGRESDPHMTILYGFQGIKPDQVVSFVEDAPTFFVRLGKVGKFEGEDHDVIKIDAESEGAREMNSRLAEHFRVTQTHPEYKPHITLAYVKKGSCDHLIGSEVFDGQEIHVRSLTYSDEKNNKHNIILSEGDIHDDGGSIVHSDNYSSDSSGCGHAVDGDFSIGNTCGSLRGKAGEAKDAIIEHAGRAFSGLPKEVQTALKGVYNAYLGTFEMASHAAELVARAHGKSKAETARLKMILAAADIAGSMITSAAVHASIGAIGGAAAGFAPLASACYLIYSSSKDPMTTLEASRRAVVRQMKKIRHPDRYEKDPEGLTDQQIAILLHRAMSLGDDYRATLCAALDETGGDIETSLRIADKIHNVKDELQWG